MPRYINVVSGRAAKAQAPLRKILKKGEKIIFKAKYFRPTFVCPAYAFLTGDQSMYI
jgi:hypothetical protein